MNILIVTRSFVREVSAFVNYAAQVDPTLRFSLVLPNPPSEPLPANVKLSIRKLWWPQRMRATCYGPAVLHDILACRPAILHLFEEFSGLIAWQALWLNRLLGRRSRVMIYSAENLRNNLRRIFRLSGEYVAARSDLAFVCSRGVQQVLAAEGYTKPITVFPLGVDTSVFTPDTNERLKTSLDLEGKFVVGYVGRLLAIKGVHLLIEMLPQLPESVHLLLVGAGPEEANLRTAAARRQVQHRVHLVGSVPYARLPQYIKCMDVGVVPSQTTSYWQEQFGRAIIELMSCEVPVIGSDSGSIPEVIGDAGIIVPEQRVPAFVQNIEGLRRNPAKRRALGKKGRMRVQAHYSQQIMCEQLLSMYRRLFSL